MAVASTCQPTVTVELGPHTSALQTSGCPTNPEPVSGTAGMAAGQPVVIRPIPLAASVNHMFPSGPGAMVCGLALGVYPVTYSAVVPVLGSKRRIRPPPACPKSHPANPVRA